MKKRNYVKPLLNSEAFEPQTYIAVCQPSYGATNYYLKCEETGLTMGGLHTTDGCRNPQAYSITVNSNGYITNIYEIGNSTFDGGNAFDITVNGNNADNFILSDPNGKYSLTWKTEVKVWPYYMPHKGTLDLSTAITVNNS